jgi:serine/threonine-protein kinase
VLYKHIHIPPPQPSTLNPDLPAELEPVLLRALAKVREDRFQRAGDFAAALRRVLAAESQVHERQEQLATLYEQMQSAASKEDWPEVLVMGGRIEALAPGHRDVSEVLAQARERLSRPRARSRPTTLPEGDQPGRGRPRPGRLPEE